MRTLIIATSLAVSALGVAALAPPPAQGPASQTPTWSADDLGFFLHGSMSTEFVPETLLRAFFVAYPELFPSGDLSSFGLIADREFGWPVGVSKGKPAHLAALPSIGVNCAACHVGEVKRGDDSDSMRVLGMTSHFDAEAFFNAVVVATVKSRDPANMKRVLAAYLDASDVEKDETRREARQRRFASEWDKRGEEISSAIVADPAAASDAGPGSLHALNPRDLELTTKRLDEGVDLAALSVSMLKLFHNMRVAIHVPDRVPTQTRPAAGPGRSDAFGTLAAGLLNAPQPPAPTKYGLLWNLGQRTWVNWDGNSRSPIGRNLLAALGLGAPLIDRDGHKVGQLDYALVERHTALSEKILPPRYPFAIDQAATERGAAIYASNCAVCHDGAESDRRLHALDEVNTDPMRARLFTEPLANRFNGFLDTLVIKGYVAPVQSMRSTQRYWAPDLAGVWARSPYLHNGSVRTMQELLTKPAARPSSFRRGSRAYNESMMGYVDEGPYVFDAKNSGNANGGHDYGTDLSDAEKRDLIEFLKTK